MLVTCASRSRRRGSVVSLGPGEGLCDRLAHCWPWAPKVTDSPLASQIQLGRVRYSQVGQLLHCEQLVERCYVHSRAVALDIFFEGRGEEITERASLAEAKSDDQKHTKADDGRREEVDSGESEQALERVWVAPTRSSQRPKEVVSEPLPVRELEDRLQVLEDTIIPSPTATKAQGSSHVETPELEDTIIRIPAATKAEGSSHVETPEPETSPPFGSPEDREIVAYASKGRSVSFTDKLRHLASRTTDEAEPSGRTETSGKAGDRTPPCPVHSFGGPASRRPSARSLASIRDGDVLHQEIDYSEQLCTCPPSKKESARLVSVSSATSQRPELDEEQQREVEVVRLLSRYSSFNPDDEKDAVPKDPLTIPQSWVPIQEQAAYVRSTTSTDGARLAETLSEIAARESRTMPERRRGNVEQVRSSRDVEYAASKRGVKRSRNEQDDGYATPVIHRKGYEVVLEPSRSRPKCRSVSAQTSPSMSPRTRRIAFAEVGTQVQHPEVRSLVLNKDSTVAFGSVHRKTETRGSEAMRSKSVIGTEAAADGSRIPSSCFLHDIVPSVLQKRKRSLFSIRTEETEPPGTQYWDEPRYTVAPASVSVPTEDFLSSRNANTTRQHAEHPDENSAAKVESGLSTQWDLLHNFPSSPVSSSASENESLNYVSRNTSALEEREDVIFQSRPHTVNSTITEEMIQQGARPKLRAPAEVSPERLELLYNRKGKRMFRDSTPETSKSEPEELTVYVQCQSADYKQEKNFKADERLLYGLPPERDYPPTDRSADSWRATPDYQTSSPTGTETPVIHPIGQQGPTSVGSAMTGDQQPMLHWKIIVHPQREDDSKSSPLLPERGPPQRAKQDATAGQK